MAGAEGSAWLVVEGYPRPRHRRQHAEGSGSQSQQFALDLIDYPRALSHWRGVFVALLVIPERGTAICVRDRTGGRTGYFSESRGRISISSSAHLLASDLDLLAEDSGYLSTMFAVRLERPANRTAFSGVRQLLPGQRLQIQGKELRLDRRPLELPSVAGGTPEERVDGFERRFRTAIDRSLPEAGPTGIMLSGGLDSGPTACVAASLLRERKERLHAVSWRLPEFPECDETDWIRTIARHADIELHEFDGSIFPAFGNLDASAADPDYPAFNAFRPLVNECYLHARNLDIPVLLNAHAGDFLYPPWETLLVDLWRRRDVRRLMRFFWKEIARAPRSIHRNKVLRGLASNLVGRSNRQPKAPEWLTPDAAAALEVQDLRSWLPEASEHGAPAYCRRLLGFGAVGGVQYETATSQRFGVARRDPFYDLDLLLFMLATPPWMSLQASQDKWLMREAMKGVLPESIRTKPRTGLLHRFFHVGYRRHLPQIRERLMDTPGWSRWVRKDYVEKALSPESGSPERMVVSACLGYVLWRERIEENPFI